MCFPRALILDCHSLSAFDSFGPLDLSDCCLSFLILTAFEIVFVGQVTFYILTPPTKLA